MLMQVKKTVDLRDSSGDIRGMYERELVENCSTTSSKYTNNLRAFDEMLQEIADTAFKMGQEEGM